MRSRKLKRLLKSQINLSEEQVNFIMMLFDVHTEELREEKHRLEIKFVNVESVIEGNIIAAINQMGHDISKKNAHVAAHHIASAFKNQEPFIESYVEEAKIQK